MEKQYLTIKEVSEYLKLPEETVYKYARGSRIPASKVGRYWRFERDEVDAWVSDHSNMIKKDVSVLVVDDEPLVRELVGKWLEASGANPVLCASGEEAIAYVKSSSVDLVLLDLLMPTMNGVETLQEIKSLKPKLPVVIVTAHFESSLMVKALELGPLTIVKKPLDRERLDSLVMSVRQRAAV